MKTQTLLQDSRHLSMVPAPKAKRISIPVNWNEGACTTIAIRHRPTMIALGLDESRTSQPDRIMRFVWKTAAQPGAISRPAGQSI